MNTRSTIAAFVAGALLLFTGCSATTSDPSAPAPEDRPTTSQVKRLADTSLAVIEAGEKVNALTRQTLNLVIDYTENPLAYDAARVARLTARLHAAVAAYHKAYDAYWDAREIVK